MKQKYTAFTLAEVLITLGIIGVVAAMTLPTVISKVDRRININRLKREYSVFQQAFQKIAAENDASFKNALAVCTDNTARHACLKDIFKAKLNTVQDCDKNSGENLSKCFAAQEDVKQLNGKPVKSSAGYFNNNTTAGVVLSDGSSASFWLDTVECNSSLNKNKQRCGWVVIDVNGPNHNPNTWGKDLYLFFIFTNQIMPADAKSTDNSCSEDNEECYQDDCETGTNYGLTCASKYLFE